MGPMNYVIHYGLFKSDFTFWLSYIFWGEFRGTGEYSFGGKVLAFKHSHFHRSITQVFPSMKVIKILGIIPTWSLQTTNTKTSNFD